MAKWTQRSYWKVVNGVRAEFRLSLAEARAAYRHLRDRLDRPVFGTDLTKHPRLVREEVRAARMELVRAIEPPEISRAERIRREVEEEIYYEDDYVEFELTADTEGGT